MQTRNFAAVQLSVDKFPSAIYSFLKAAWSIKGYKKNGVERSSQASEKDQLVKDAAGDDTGRFALALRFVR